MRPIHLEHGHPGCKAVRELLTVVGSRWAVLLVSMLAERPKRFSELKREIGDITPKSLTAVLRELEKDGVVERKVTPIVPPRVDYALTDLGRSLLGPIDALASWAVENQQAVAEARKRFVENSAAE